MAIGLGRSYRCQYGRGPLWKYRDYLMHFLAPHFRLRGLRFFHVEVIDGAGKYIRVATRLAAKYQLGGGP